jgi:hypothetical protein
MQSSPWVAGSKRGDDWVLDGPPEFVDLIVIEETIT